MNDDDYRILLGAARTILAWDDNFKTTPSFDTINKMVNFGTGFGNLLKTIFNKVYKDAEKYHKEASDALHNAYVGKEKLTGGVPDELGRHAQVMLKDMSRQISQSALKEASNYPHVQPGLLAPALMLVPISEAVLTIYKAAALDKRGGQIALTQAKEATPTRTSQVQPRTALNHDQQMIKKLDTVVLPWLANEAAKASGAGKAIFPGTDLRNRGIQLAHKIVDNVRATVHSHTDLLASYKVENQESLKHMLTSQVLFGAVQSMEAQEVILENKTRQLVQRVLLLIRNQAAQEKNEKTETETETDENANK